MVPLARLAGRGRRRPRGGHDRVLPGARRGGERGGGDGSIAESDQHPVVLPYPVYAPDFDGDGLPDLLAVGSPDIGLLVGHGNGTFTVLRVPWGEVDGQSAVADFDGNGVADVASLTNAEEPRVALALGSRTCVPQPHGALATIVTILQD